MLSASAVSQLSAAAIPNRELTLERQVPWVLFALGLAAIWIPERPPMADLPQHAGQIALLHDLVLGTSPWKGEVWVNPFAPYLLGYCLALPLTFVMPVAAALKCVLTSAYAAFGLAGVAIRGELGGSARMDGCYFISFLGFAYSWGLFTYLVAAPVGLAFVWLSIRFARDSTVRRGAALALLGCLLLFSHGLVFLFASAIGAAIIWLKNPNPKSVVTRALAFVPSVALAGLIFLAIHHQDAAQAVPYNAMIKMGSLLSRLQQFFTNPFGLPARLPFACFLLVLAAPIAGGLKLNTERRECFIPLGLTVAALMLAPYYVWSTAFVFNRLSLFLPPAFAWIFTDRKDMPRAGAWRTDAALFVAGLLAIVPHVVQAARFSEETRDFDKVMARAAPGQRALGLVEDIRTASGPDPAVNEFMPLWYQADKRGLVDPNFGMLHEEVVRLRNISPADIDPAFPFHADQYSWRIDDAGRYRYFFVRSAGPVPLGLFRDAPCAPGLLAESGEWRLFEGRKCQGYRRGPSDPKGPGKA